MNNVVQSAPFMPPTRTIIIFGDLTYSFQPDLQQLIHVRGNANLSDFFTRISFAFRHEFASLPHLEQQWLPRFTELADLLENVNQTEGAPALRFALLSVYQIGRFISHYGKRKAMYPTPENTYVLGLCTGSFATAAISTARTIAELIPAGIQAVIYAFRTAFHSFKLQRDLERSLSPTAKSWSAAIALPEQLAAVLVENYAVKRGITKRHVPFISTVTPTNVTISGPPSILEDLLSSTTPRAHFLPIETPFHAPHLYGSEDVEDLLHKPVNGSLELHKLAIPIISSTSGVLVTEGSFDELLRRAIYDTLCQQIRWDKVLPACVDLISQDDLDQGCTILPCASNAATLLTSALSSIKSNRLSINNGLCASDEKIQPAMPTGRFEDDKIAITGFSGRFPDAASNNDFWELLRSGKDTHRTIPKDRFDWEAHFDPSGATKNTSKVKYGCFVEEPGMFDTRFFHMSPKEAEHTDPAQRLALMTTYEALEMAGFVPDRTPSSQRDRVGVFFGTTSDDWREVNSGQNIGTYFIPGGNRAFVPGRITFFFRFSGPSISVDTACSSSFAALHVACQSLWQGGCDTAIVGGTNILTNPDNFAGLDRGHFLSTTGNCNPFDDEASGYCRADAVASLILKRLKDAEADSDPIYGVIAGVDTNHCGQTESITRPHEGDQLSLFKRILRQSNTRPIDVNYVEMHGTGTQAGDAAEMSSVLAAMVPGRERMPHHPLHLGAVKANVGHAESASGVSALIKVLMMMQHNEMPPHVGIKNRINKHYPHDLAERNVNIAFKPTVWTRANSSGGKRVSFLNNFSAAGGNTAVLLEDAPERQQDTGGIDGRILHPVAITANSSKSLKANMASLLRYLAKTPNISLPALSYTTTARRAHHKFRALLTGRDIVSIESALVLQLDSVEEVSAIPQAKRLPSVAFIFTGQGTLYAGLGKHLFETVQSFRQDILRFNRIAQQHGYPSFLPLIEHRHDELIVEDFDTVVAHVALVCVQMALYRLWVSWGVVPNVTIGHSLGEYPAFYSAGVLSASDTIYLAGARARILSDHCFKGSHCMVSVKAPHVALEHTMSTSSCDVACVNSPMNTVISGPSKEIERITENFRADGFQCVLLGIPYAFHSAQVDTWINAFEMAAGKIQYHAPTGPYMSPLLRRTISAHEAGVLNGDYLVKACRATVNFSGAIEAGRDAGIVNADTIWLELGSHPACSTFIKQILGQKSTTIPSLRQAIDPWMTLVPGLQTFFLRGFDINWNEYHRYFPAAQQVLSLPSYNWDLRNYWIMYRGNFCLTKGDETIPAQKLMGSPAAPYLSSSVHHILEEHNATDKSTLLTESDVYDPRLYPIAQGHKVNSVALCPSSLYADMALTIARYMLRANKIPADDIGLDCSNMKVDRPLIVSPEISSALLQVSASADWSRSEISLALFSVNRESQKIADHATCTVKITKTPAKLWLQNWNNLAHLIQGRISSLQKSVNEGNSHKLKRGLTYKLFSSLVEYANEYQGMQEVILDSEGFEATAQVIFQTGDSGFEWNPCWIDSLGHIAGFIMNGNDNIHTKDHVFVNHGWSGMRCAKKIECDTRYRTYVKMIPQDDDGAVYAGDTYILDNGKIVAIFEGVKFSRVPRSVLGRLLKSKEPPNVAKAQQRLVQKSLDSIPEPKAIPGDLSPAPISAQSTIITQLKAIFVEEAGIDIGQFDPDTSFAELGVDSLLSITISGRAQDELGLNMSPSTFSDFPTLNHVVSHFAPSERNESDSSINSTPSLDEDENHLGEITRTTSIASEREVMSTIRATIAKKMGLPVEELDPTTNLLDLGIDRVLSLTITKKLDQLGVGVLSNFLTENQTLQSIEKALQNEKLLQSRETDLPVEERDILLDRPNPISFDGPPHATSVRLQGSSKVSRRLLWLFPDGAGSATSYSTLPKISPEWAVYGLNCPWLKTPQDLRYSIPEYVSKFVIEIRRRQPDGPYNFGGWSAGGILAFEAAQQLARQGQPTSKLILLDSPNPIGIQSPPKAMYDFLESLDIFATNGREAPEWLRPHFTAFITMLDQYRPVPFSSSVGVPRTHMIYARDGLCKNPEDPRPELPLGGAEETREMTWLLNNRTNFSGEGWRDLVGERNLQVSVLENANHYNMLRTVESANKIGQLIASHLDS